MKRQNQQLKHQNLQIKLTKGTDDALPTVLNAGFCNTQYWAMLVPQHVILQQPPLPVALRQWLVVIVCHSYMMLYVYIYIYLQYLRKPASTYLFSKFPPALRFHSLPILPMVTLVPRHVFSSKNCPSLRLPFTTTFHGYDCSTIFFLFKHFAFFQLLFYGMFFGKNAKKGETWHSGSLLHMFHVSHGLMATV